MSVYLENDVVLVRYPFVDLQDSKVRPAIIVSTLHVSQAVTTIQLNSSRNQTFASGIPPPSNTNSCPGETVLRYTHGSQRRQCLFLL